jgi:hypothetical protein
MPRQRPKGRRLGAEHQGEPVRTTQANQARSLDFVADQLTDGRRFRALTVVHVFTREGLAIEVGQALPGTDGVKVLNRPRFQRRAPRILFCDNGSEITSQIMDLWRIRSESRSTSAGQGSRPTMRTSKPSAGRSEQSSWTRNGSELRRRPSKASRLGARNITTTVLTEH